MSVSEEAAAAASECYAKDLGLYLPEEIPGWGRGAEAAVWLLLSQLVFEVARRFIDEAEIPSADLEELVGNSLSGFKVPEVVRVERLGGGLNVVELFHGATLAFKDLALQVVSALLHYFLKTSGQHVTILVGTSGDTGSAAIEGVRGRGNMDIVVLLPKGYCTAIQELQMTTVLEDNVHVYCVDGTSDALDLPIKQCFADGQLVESHSLISINSINWGRIMVQVAHFFHLYFQLCEDLGQPVQVVIPTGACGNITAGCIAQRMGLPITLVAGVNTNNIVARTLDTGDFSVEGNVMPSLAPAMDIQMPYNVERLLFLYAKGDTGRVKKLMEEFESRGRVQIPKDVLEAMKKTVVGEPY
ncbi:Threonine synthase-like 2 [Chionoecetes opilio]|uniref:Threonine synthase-like 2 n=1 Tax=Chionoecetes opilio TaxID=41210 RepID=A0A8J4XMG9_CHIOP|nr:Threonine synthase-like 2 [Chionoecetes opilio]